MSDSLRPQELQHARPLRDVFFFFIVCSSQVILSSSYAAGLLNLLHPNRASALTEIGLVNGINGSLPRLSCHQFSKFPPNFLNLLFLSLVNSRVINVCFHSFAQFYHCFLSRGFTLLLTSSEVREEMEMATHSSILAWKIPWTEEPSWLQSTGSQRVRHN